MNKKAHSLASDIFNRSSQGIDRALGHMGKAIGSGAEGVMSALEGGKYGEMRNKKVNPKMMEDWRKSKVGRFRNAMREAAGKSKM